MSIFGKRKRRSPYSPYDGRGANTLDAAEAELLSLDMKIEDKLLDIKEESRDRKFRLPRSLMRR